MVDAGFCNRLRALAAFMFVAEKNYNGAHVGFIWDINEACPGHFLEVFEPINTVFFAQNYSRGVLSSAAVKTYKSTTDPLPFIFQKNGIHARAMGYRNLGPIERALYSQFVPNSEVYSIVSDFVKMYDLCTAVAMHVRMTDLNKRLVAEKKNTALEDYFRYVERLPASQPVFLMTDNPDTQQLFLSKYGSKKVIVYKKLVGATVDGVSIPIARNAVNTTGTPPEERRFTTIKHFVIELLIAAHTLQVRQSKYSSASEAILIFKHVFKNRGLC